MAATRDIDGIDGRQARLKPAAAVMQPLASGTAGPFEAAAPRRNNSTTGEALVTGLLIVYPAFATVAAIVVGLMLAGGV